MYSSDVKTLEIKHLIERISISRKSIEIGNIPISTLSREHVKSFPIAIAFVKTKLVPFTLSVSSSENWCLVPDKIDVDEKTDVMNLPLGIDLELLHIAGLRKENKESQHYELKLEICVSEKEKSENKKCVSVVIPVNVKWIIDIPFIDNPGRPKVDETEIIFDPLHLPNSSDKLQKEQIHVTNVGDTRITCDLLYPQWIRPDPSCLVLEPGETKESSIQIDSAYVKAGSNSDQIEIKNSDIKINVSVDVTANGPVPQFENDISITIPHEKVNADYIYTFEVVNVGNGELHVTLPINMDDLERKTTYKATDRLDILLTIPQSDISSNQNDAFNFSIETNSVLDRLKNVQTRLQYTIEPVEEVKPLDKQEEQTEQKVVKKLILPTINIKKDDTKKEKKNYVTISLVAAFLVTIFLSVMFYSMRNSNTVSIKPIPSKATAPQTNNTPIQSNGGIAQKAPQLPVPVPKGQPVRPKTLPEDSSPNISVIKKDEIQENTTPEPKENNKERSIELQDRPVRIIIPIPEPEKTISYIKISIHTTPRAWVSIDKKQPELAPVENITIQSGKHIINIEAINNPSRTKTLDREFFKDGEDIKFGEKKGEIPW